jgi:hypothetical protein
MPSSTPLREVKDDGKALPTNAALERLARTNPIAFLEHCLRRYEREIKGYQVIMHKHERIKGKMLRPEVVAVSFREKPYSVLMDWQKGVIKARRTLFVKGENKDKLLVRPTGLASLVGVVSLDPLGADVKASTRYPPTEFGIKIAMERTLASWHNAHKRGKLKMTYLGEKRLKQAGNRLCWVIKRTDYEMPEEDGITEATFYFDKENWLQIGTILKDADDKLIGEYYFRDIKVNPKFNRDTFTRKSL